MALRRALGSLCCLALGAQAWANGALAITRVQSQVGISATGTLTLGFPAGTLPGDVVFACIDWCPTGVLAVSDDRGDGYVALGVPLASSTWPGSPGCAAATGFAESVVAVVDAGAQMFTYTVPGAAHMAVFQAEYAGTSTTRTVDAFAQLSSNAGSTTMSVELITQAANDALVACGWAAGQAQDAGTGFATITYNNGDLFEDGAAGAPGPYLATVFTNDPAWTLAAVALAPAQAGPPSILSVSATEVTSTSATFNATVNPNLGYAAGWFRYAPGTLTSCSDTFGTRVPALNDDPLGAGGVPVAFSEAESALTPATTYSLCALADNKFGGAVSSPMSFTTLTADAGPGDGGASDGGSVAPDGGLEDDGGRAFPPRVLTVACSEVPGAASAQGGVLLAALALGARRRRPGAREC